MPSLDYFGLRPLLGTTGVFQCSSDTGDSSIHVPHMGSDPYAAILGRLPDISIHAPHTGSDLEIDQIIINVTHFNPRSPYGERPKAALPGDGAHLDFNPRSPYGERRGNHWTASCKSYFNPRSPYGERQQRCTKK